MYVFIHFGSSCCESTRRCRTDIHTILDTTRFWWRDCGPYMCADYRSFYHWQATRGAHMTKICHHDDLHHYTHEVYIHSSLYTCARTIASTKDIHNFFIHDHIHSIHFNTYWSRDDTHLCIFLPVPYAHNIGFVRQICTGTFSFSRMHITSCVLYPMLVYLCITHHQFQSCSVWLRQRTHTQSYINTYIVRIEILLLFKHIDCLQTYGFNITNEYIYVHIYICVNAKTLYSLIV